MFYSVKFRFLLIVFTLISFLSLDVYAQDGGGTTEAKSEPSLNKNYDSDKDKVLFFVGQFGVGFGGDAITTINYSDGTDEDLNGGEGFFINAGFFVTPFPHRNLETQFNFGYAFAKSQEATNGSVTWSKMYVDIMQFYRFDSFRIGAGITYHIDPKVDGTDEGTSYAKDADENAQGTVFAIDWFFGERGLLEFTVGFKFVNISYKFDGESKSGNSIGVSLGIIF